MNEITQPENVLTMAKEPLQDYLYNYVSVKKSLAAFQAKRQAELQRLTQERRAKKARLDESLEQYQLQVEHGSELRAKHIQDKIDDKLLWVKNLKFWQYWLALTLVMGTIGTLLDFRQIVGSFLISATVALIFSVGIWLILKLAYPLVRGLITMLVALSVKATATFEKIRTRNLTDDQVQANYNYPAKVAEVNQEYDGLEQKISHYQADYYQKLTSQVQLYQQTIPQQVDQIGYLAYMHEQLYVGAADTWKEAVRLLEVQIQHAETMGALQNLAGKLEQNTQSMIAHDEKIDQAFHNLDQEMSHSFAVINTRIDGLFSSGYFY